MAEAMTHYPGAELALWKYNPANPAYFKGINRPVAVVLHIAQGWASTARAWAASGYSGASWHYFVCLDGTVIQQLEHEDGGYHAGIASPPAPTPTWPLWKGSHLNINCYTIGIEHEGFSGDGFTPLQRDASVALCRWLSDELGFPYDREHFPAHADIDLINRPSDFGPPEYREEHYRFMFEEDNGLKLTEEQTDNLLLRLFAGSEYDGVENREQRLQRAMAELGKAETTQSLNDAVLSAIALSKPGGPHSHPEYVLKAELAEASD